MTLKSRNSTRPSLPRRRVHSTLLVGQPEVVSPLTRSLGSESLAQRGSRRKGRKKRNREKNGTASCNRKLRSWREGERERDDCKSQHG